ncbi:RNA-binding protein pno1-like [Aphidius gifuensis]|uniref:RNA-binding protein pno1-like n=1 Tax=Aphidius gifuensis TaxID=684658 RepID=UPI001CDD18E1|nr:RNA-binding protein pno1-like [Aphidius gifuensis]
MGGPKQSDCLKKKKVSKFVLMTFEHVLIVYSVTSASGGGGGEQRQIPVPNHRKNALEENWIKIITPIVEHLSLQIMVTPRFTLIKLRTGPETTDIANIQKAEDFIRAFLLGFDINDAIALIRLDDLFVESFQVQDVKPLKGDHLSRAIGRLAGEKGKMKHSIENQTQTRIVLADAKIHILGSFQNIQLARRVICNLILGAPISKVTGQLRNLSKRK